MKSLKYRISASICSAALMVGMAVTVLPSAYAEESHTGDVVYASDLQDLKLTAIKVLREPTRQVYQVNDQFDSRGLIVAGIDSEGHIHYLSSSLYTLAGFDSSKTGNQTITVSLKENAELSTSFTVEVVPSSTGNYEISSLSGNSSDGVVAVNNGAVKINLDRVPQEDSTVTVKRGVKADDLSSITFTANSGRVRHLVIEPWALAQQSTNPTLSSVVFPENLDSLMIGDSAFFQYSSETGGALSRLQFPHKINNLTIGRSAFRQDVRLKASLKDVVFPEQVNTLSIGDMAFRQKFGVTGGLRSLVFSVNEGAKVDVKTLAFSASGSYMAGSQLQSVTINTANAKSLGTQFLVAKRAFLRTNVNAEWSVSGLKATVRLGELLPSVAADASLKDKEVKASQVVRFNLNCTDSAYIPENVPSPQTLIEGANSTFTTVLTSSQPTRKGYIFLGWNTAADGKGTDYKPGASFSTTSTDPVTVLYAQWQAEKSTLTLNANGGENDQVVEGTTDQLTTIPQTLQVTRKGYELVDWNTAADGSGVAYKAGDNYRMLAGETVLYAQWKINSEAGSSSDNSGKTNEQSDQPIKKTDNPVKSAMTPEMKKDMKKLAQTGQSIIFLTVVMALCAVVGVGLCVKRFRAQK